MSLATQTLPHRFDRPSRIEPRPTLQAGSWFLLSPPPRFMRTRHPGDGERLFGALVDLCPPSSRVLYPAGDAPTADELHRLGRGIAYTKSPFAYLFRKA